MRNATTRTLIAVAVAACAAGVAAGVATAIEIPGRAKLIAIPAETKAKLLRAQRRDWDHCDVYRRGRTVECYMSSLTYKIEVSRWSHEPGYLWAEVDHTSNRCCGSMTVGAWFNMRTLRIDGRWRLVGCKEFSRASCTKFRDKFNADRGTRTLL